MIFISKGLHQRPSPKCPPKCSAALGGEGHGRGEASVVLPLPMLFLPRPQLTPEEPLLQFSRKGPKSSCHWFFRRLSKATDIC